MKKGLLREHSSTLLLFSKVIDFILVWATAYLAYLIRFSYSGVVLSSSAKLSYQFAFLFSAIVMFLAFNLFDLYSPMRSRSLSRFFARLLWAWLSSLCVLLLIAFITKTSDHFSRQWFIWWAVLGFIVIFIYRLGLAYLLRYMRSQGFNQRKIFLIGEGELAEKILTTLKKSTWLGYEVLAHFSEYQQQHVQPLSAVTAFLEKYRIDEIWIAMPLKEEEKIKSILHDLRYETATIRLVPDIFGMQLLNHSMTEVAGLPVLNLRETPMVGAGRLVKFLEDKLFSVLILLLLSPVFLLIALLVKLSSPGPVFYLQERVSWNNKKFMMLKFRSMPVGTENKSGAVWAKAGEQRATKIGAFLRKTSLDELPQFINVLKGDMSIVGPRPERPVFVDKFKQEIPGYMQKHMVKAGITGWAQIHGYRGDTSLGKRIECDLYYINNWSLWLDLKIIFMTVFKGFVNKNAY